MSRDNLNMSQSIDSPVSLQDGKVVNWKELKPGCYILQNKPGPWDVAIARVSTDDQVREGCSLEQQVNLALDCAAKNGHSFARLYFDPGISATKNPLDSRPGTRVLVEDIRRKKIRTIYMYKRDRVSRNTEEWISFLGTCGNHGVKIQFTCPGELPIGEGVYGKFTETLIISLAELEAGITRMRVVDSTRDRFQEGRYIGGNLPFGLFQGDDRTIRPHPDEAPIVRLIFKLATEELLGDMKIAMRLNAEYPLSFRGHSWTRSKVLRVLKNRTYCGYFHMTLKAQSDGTPTRERMEQRSNLLPEIVPEEVWELARRLRTARTPRRGRSQSRYRSTCTLLSGIVICGECGHIMETRLSVQKHSCNDGAVHEYRHHYFRCPRGQGIRNCSNRGTASTSLIEEAVLRACSQVLPGMEVGEVLARTREFAERSRRELEATLAENEAEMPRVDGAIKRNQDLLELAITQEETEHYHQRLRQLVSQRAEMQERIGTIRTNLSLTQCSLQDVRRWMAVVSEWPVRFDPAAYAAKRRMLLGIIDRVVWHSQTRQIDIVLRFGDTQISPEEQASIPVRFTISGLQIPKRKPQGNGAILVAKSEPRSVEAYDA